MAAESAERSEQKQKVLLVDDEQVITDRLAPFLTRAGYEVEVAMDGEKALEMVDSFSPDLVVLDVLMPKLDGREVLRHLREKDNWTPVILLTQVGGADERTMALMEGADDYLNKPFDSNELAARIKAVLRRAKPGQPPLMVTEQLCAGDLMVDRRQHRAYYREQQVDISPKAFALLEFMLTHPQELLTRERLLDAVWGWDYPIGTRSVDTRVAEIRRLLGDDPGAPKFIETVTGSGYRFIAVVEPVS